ncbi:MAG: histone deacetylase [Caldilineaceae bacterium]|nr:histone deacetylase [Caldilineaceae bacterium]
MTTGYTYDPFNLNHTFYGHPENHRRLERTWALLQSDGILDRLRQIESIPAPIGALAAVHDAGYLARLTQISAAGGGRLDADTYVTAKSNEAARLAAGALLNLTDAVLRGEVDNGFALGRPPGHHARPQRGMGFCLLGNVAIAARHAQSQHGIERVLIVDFDVHHGNGTQEIFYEDGSVLFFSIHQYPHYPGSGALDETGVDAGAGATVNIPFPADAGDDGYLAALRQILGPLARRHQPEVIFVSAGYDAHWMDPLAQHALSIAGYATMAEELMGLADELCGGRLICTLEGGYNLEVLPHVILTTLRVLSGDGRGISDPVGKAPGKERNVAAVIEAARRIHRIMSNE